MFKWCDLAQLEVIRPFFDAKSKQAYSVFSSRLLKLSRQQQQQPQKQQQQQQRQH